MHDPFTYFTAAFFIAWINAILCGQRIADRRSGLTEKLRSAALYTLMLVLLFACPLLFEPRWEFLAAGTTAGYLHYFFDRAVAHG